MIHYHGAPITPTTAAYRVWRGRHAFVSFAHPGQITLAAEVCQSFALDNGAFSVWKAGRTVDWRLYYRWVDKWKSHPGCDFAIIPDLIDGSEEDNDRLLSDWSHGQFGVPVWHMHESLDRLTRLCGEWPRVAIGSSGAYSVVGNSRWWDRMTEAMNVICRHNGRPTCKIHGLRMLNPSIFQYLPLGSADSTNVARNIGIDSKWSGTYQPSNKEVRALIIAERIEHWNSAGFWNQKPVQRGLFT